MSNENHDLERQLRRAKGRGVPFLCIETTDAWDTHLAILKASKPRKEGQVEVPVFTWDVIRGTSADNDSALPLCPHLLQWDINGKDSDITEGIGGGTQLLRMANNPTVCAHQFNLVIQMAHHHIGDPEFLQAMWNLRQLFKSSRCMLILVAPMFALPPEVSGDIILLQDPLPGRDRLPAVIEKCIGNANQHPDVNISLTEREHESLVDATTGLPFFQAEQVVSMSLEKDGPNLDLAWDQKRKHVAKTPGLSIWCGSEKFDDIGGVAAIKKFMSAVMGGKSRPRGLVVIEEIEKALAGARGDTSGVSQDALGVVLEHMQNTNAIGLIFIGPPGTSKSMMAKASGNEYGVPSIQLDFGGMKGPLLGTSEGHIRAAMKVIESVCDGRSLWIATSNGISQLPPELRRRFTLGTYFFGLPDDDERRAIWDIWAGKYELELPKSVLSESKDWTGAEIRQCADIMWRCGYDFKQAKECVVPMAIACMDSVRSLQNSASGRFLSASKPGVYEKPSEKSV